MSQPGIGAHRVQQLEQRLRQTKEEARAIENELMRVRSSASATTAPNFESVSGDYLVSSLSRSPLKDYERSRTNAVPRTADAGRLEPEHSQQLDQIRPIKRSKTTHTAGLPTTQQLMRSTSSASSGPSTRAAPNRSSISGPVSAPRPAIPSASLASGGQPEMMDSLLGHGQMQQPLSTPIHDDMSLSAHPPSQMSAALSVTGREMDVAEFLLMRDGGDVRTSPIGIPSSQLLSPNDALHFGGHSGIPSACGSMTSGPTLDTAPMSRVNSSINDSSTFLGQFSKMVRITSHQSLRGHARQESYGNAQHMMHHMPEGKRPSADSDFMDMGANLDNFYNCRTSAPVDSGLFTEQYAMERSTSKESSTSSSSADMAHNPEFQSQLLAAEMERSVSKDSMFSVKSSASLKLRAKEALIRQNDNAVKSRHLQPKPAVDTIKEPAEPIGPQEKDGKAVIAKAKYERPKHPKVRCLQCNENPGGFRGEHELRRHTEAKHKSTVKRWICRDPGLEGIPHAETATKPLSECKHCSQRKPYGAYYNAAAHLRRTHFRVKSTRKSVAGSKNGSKGTSPTGKVEEKRGGKGGGDWPPMSELKLWMVEVTVPMEQNMIQDGMDTAVFPENDDMEGEIFDAHYDVFGVGSGFTSDRPPLQAHHGEFSAPADLFSLDTTLYSPHGLPISSSGFEYSATADQHQHGMASSIMSVDTHGYTSPVSSTATLTQGGLYGDHAILPTPTMLPSRDDLADMSFDMTFSVSH